MTAKLPLTPKEFSSNFPGNSITDIFRKCQNPAKLTPIQNAIWKYSGGSLVTGRPLNTTMIFMAGTSGSGKSSTINALFDDPELCATSSFTSETKNPILLQKELGVVHPSQPKICGNLCFVDVPGTFDTDAKNEVVNLASIQKFRQSRIELADRKELVKSIPKKYADLSQKVYPNLVLFVVRATDNRMLGPDSFFSKSLNLLKSTSDLIDVRNPNLIIVLSHIMALPPRRFTQLVDEKKRQIQGIVMNILGIQDVPVVPVENAAEDYDLEKRGDFYVLPNGEYSHHNLFQAMLKTFQKNNDLLGQLLVGWYFNPKCPERKKKATVIESQEELTTEDLAMAGLNLQDSNVVVSPDHLASLYNFQSLGYGYCPVTEEVKPVCLINAGDASERKLVEIDDSKFLIPKCVTPYFNRSSRFRQLSFFEKEEYQSHMQASYGLEAGFKLVVSASSEGRWVNSASGSGGSSVISVDHEIQYVTFKMDDPRSQITNTLFMRELHGLPDKYNNDTAKTFQSFFSKWGSHLIYDQAVGGAIRFFCTVQNASVSRDKFQEIQASVSGVFKSFSAAASGGHKLETNALKAVGVTNEQFQIDGGDPPSIVTVETLKADELAEWKKTVPQRPSELKKSIKLYPYYNLLESGDKYNVLQEATKDYLRATLEEKIKSVYEPTRGEAAEGAVNNAVQTPPKQSCFPKGTMITLQDFKGQKPIEALGSSSLGTLKLKKKAGWEGIYTIPNDDSTSATNFCTYLDKLDNIGMEYLVLHFSNGKRLIVSEAHFVFQYIPDNGGVVTGKQAKHFKIGERMIYFDPSGIGEIETPAIMEITREMHVGAYSPLTMSGTFFADGFFVSSYANTNSFTMAQTALLPLKYWSKINNSKKGEKKEPSKKSTDGLHPYAKFLISFRKAFTILTMKDKP